MNPLHAEEFAGLASSHDNSASPELVRIPVDGISLPGELCVPPLARGVVLITVANGYIRDNPRYPVIARTLDASGLATVTIRLLTPSEAAKDEHTGYWSFDLELLSHRIREATHWVSLHPRLRELDIGFLGSGTGAAAALVVAAQLGAAVHAVVSRGGRPDLGRDYLPRVTASTLLIVGEKDEAVCDLNRQAFSQLLCPKEMTIVAGSDHLFGEAGALEKVASLAAAWFAAHLRSGTRI